MLASMHQKMETKYKALLPVILIMILVLWSLYSYSRIWFFKRTDPKTNQLFGSGYNSTLVKQSLKTLGYGLLDFPERNELWTGKTHLCIMFNLASVKPNKIVINALISYYFPFFKNISLIFDGHPNSNLTFVPSFINVMFCESHLGWYQQKCIRKCIQQNDSETDGHLYIADDMFINITKMAELPKSKIWFVENWKKSMSWIENPGPKGWGWHWWGPPYGNNVKLKKTIESFPRNWRVILEKYHGFPDNFSVIATSDIIYIPQSDVPKIIPVLDHIISQGDLFCEIATPLAVNVASPDFVKMQGSYLWKDRSVAMIERVSRTAHFVHPVKLGIAGHAALWVRYMEQQLNLTITENKAKAISSGHHVKAFDRIVNFLLNLYSFLQNRINVTSST